MLRSLIGAARAGGLPRRVVFLHIPKTAGSSIHAFFRNRARRWPFGPPRLIDDRVLTDPRRLARARRARYAGGHFGAQALAAVRGNAVAFTVLRDPLARLVSAWQYTQTLEDPTQRSPHETLEAALASGDERMLQGLDNPMARQLAVAYDARIAAGVPRDEWVGRARETLAGLDMVLRQDRLDQDFARLLALAGIEAAQGLGHLNRTDDPERKRRDPALPLPSLPDETRLRALAEPFVALDRAVCEGWL